MVVAALSKRSRIPSLSESKSNASSIPSPSESLAKEVNSIFPENADAADNPLERISKEKESTRLATNSYVYGPVAAGSILK